MWIILWLTIRQRNVTIHNLNYEYYALCLATLKYGYNVGYLLVAVLPFLCVITIRWLMRPTVENMEPLYRLVVWLPVVTTLVIAIWIDYNS